jgi:hypothetical protein
MKLLIGLIGGFLVMGSAGSLETDVMSITQTLGFAISGFGLVLYVLISEELV